MPPIEEPKTALEKRPVAGQLIVPYMVDAAHTPIDFKRVDPDHVKRCGTARRCGICGGKIRSGPIAFIGPDDGRSCFADPWMHLDCAKTAMVQCPFLAGRTTWREEDNNPLLRNYAHNMTLFSAPSGEAHKDGTGAWHFKAVGTITREDLGTHGNQQENKN